MKIYNAEDSETERKLISVRSFQFTPISYLKRTTQQGRPQKKDFQPFRVPEWQKAIGLRSKMLYLMVLVWGQSACDNIHPLILVPIDLLAR